MKHAQVGRAESRKATTSCIRFPEDVYGDGPLLFIVAPPFFFNKPFRLSTAEKALFLDCADKATASLKRNQNTTIP